MSAKTYFTLVAVILVPVIFEYLLACTCVPPNPPAIEFEARDVIFSGQVVTITIEGTDHPGLNICNVTFSVIQSWKGVTDQQATVRTPLGDNICGYAFETDSSYLVYADSSGEFLNTSICTRTRRLTEASEDLQYLHSLDLDEWYPVPKEYWLFQNYPNPFNPVSTIRYELPKGSDVSLVVYDILGREVAKLVDRYVEPGYHSVTWNSRTDTGRQVPSSIYIARLVTPEYTKSIKMLLLK